MKKLLSSRRIRALLIGSLISLTIALLAYRIFWHPQTLRGRFNRVQLGMTEKQLKEILGEPGIFWTSDWPGVPHSIELWCLKDDKVKHERFDTRFPLPEWTKNVLSDSQLTELDWRYDQAGIRVWLDNRRLVSGKVWTAHHQSTIWERMCEWCAWP